MEALTIENMTWKINDNKCKFLTYQHKNIFKLITKHKMNAWRKVRKKVILNWI